MDTDLHVCRHHEQFNQLSSEWHTKTGLICNISQCSGEVVERLARTYDGRNEMQVDQRNEDWQAQLTVMLVTDERQVMKSQADEAATIRTTAFRDPENQSCQNITLLNETLSISVLPEKLITHLWHGKKMEKSRVWSKVMETSTSGVAKRGTGSAGRTRWHLIGAAANWRKWLKKSRKISDCKFHLCECNKKQSLRASTIVGFIGSLTASVSTFLVLRLGLPRVPGRWHCCSGLWSGGLLRCCPIWLSFWGSSWPCRLPWLHVNAAFLNWN